MTVEKHEDAPVEFPLRRRCPFDPPAEYAKWRADEPIVRVALPDGSRAWLVTRHEDVRALLRDSRLSADRSHPEFPFTEVLTPQSRMAIAAVGRSLIGLDTPEHGPKRAMLMAEFTLRRMEQLRPFVQRVVDEHLDRLLAGPALADLVSAFAVPVPAIVLCELLGVPYADRSIFAERAEALVRRSTDPALRQRAGGELRAYLDALVTREEADPGPNLIGRLVVRNREEAVFDHGLIVSIAMLLLVAGHDSTTSMIALSTARLLSSPVERARIAADRVADRGLVEELLRYLAVVDTMARVATEDVRVGAVTIRAGEGVLVCFASANRDESAFAHAANLDVERGARNHVAFGYGMHQCLGANLARLQLSVALPTLLRRIPTLRLAAPLAELPFADDSDVYGMERLPVTW